MFLIFSAFLLSCLMFFYVCLDFLFGFTARSSIKSTKGYKHPSFKKYFSAIDEVLKDCKQKFRIFRLGIVIEKSQRVNAFAVGSFYKNYVILTVGLLEHLMQRSENEEEFKVVLRSVIGHEISHLINKDFLPGAILMFNRKATSRVANVYSFCFAVVFLALSRFPALGKVSSRVVNAIFSVVRYVVMFFMEKIVMKLYKVFSNILTRSIEYRSDRESGMAFGGKPMALALALIGGDGYNNIFSSHPSTISRVKLVEGLPKANGIIKEKFIISISNAIIVIFTLYLPFYLAKVLELDVMYSKIMYSYGLANQYYGKAWSVLDSFLRFIGL